MPATAFVGGATWALALAVLGACFATLTVVGILSWRRTRPLRLGDDPDTATAGGQTSPVTYAPAIAGVAIGVIGYLAAASRAPPLPVFVLATAGVTVAVSGLSGRVTAIRVRPNGMVFRYAGRPSFPVQWSEFGSIRPPRWPLGGWKIERADGAARVLMPSDLRGLESILAVSIALADLHFDGKVWRRADAISSGLGSPSRFRSPRGWVLRRRRNRR